MPPTRNYKARGRRKECPPISRATAALEKPSRTVIETSLKDLRAISKQLSSSLALLHDELRILERLYYKNKNQHRSAVFWRKVVELRKFGGRVRELGTSVSEDVEGLRGQFYGAGKSVEVGAKVLKGPWTHVADAAFASNALKQVYVTSELIAKARTRNQSIHHALELAMQTGAFLQLTLVLMAILCRIDFPMSELAEALVKLAATLESLMTVLDKGFIQKPLHKSKPTTPLPALPPVPSTSSSSRVNLTDIAKVMGEDIGETVERPAQPASPAQASTEGSRASTSAETAQALPQVTTQTITSMVIDTEEIFTERMELSFPDLPAPKANDIPPHTASHLSESIVDSKMSKQAKTTLSTSTPLPTKNPQQNEAVVSISKKTKIKPNNGGETHIKKKRKKRPKDEIDDIFGGL